MRAASRLSAPRPARGGSSSGRPSRVWQARGHTLLGGPRSCGSTVDSKYRSTRREGPPVILSPALECNHAAFHDTS